MPTEAISALPTATTANAADLVLVNQAGVTKTVPASAIAALAPGGSSGATTLAALTDVAESAPTSGQVLTYNAATGKWVNATPSGGSSAQPVSASFTSSVSDNGSVTTDTLIPGMTLTLPASSTAITYAVALTCNFSAGASEQIRWSLYLDGVNQSPSATVVQPGLFTAYSTVIIPGDNATHNVDFRYQDNQNVGVVTFANRSITATPATATPAGSGAVALVGAAYPPNPSLGQICYRKDLAHLYVWDGATWQQA
jgi:hypothetical protein